MTAAPASISSMRDEVVRIKEGDLMDLRARVHELERENEKLRSVLRAELHWQRERVPVMETILGEDRWPGA